MENHILLDILKYLESRAAKTQLAQLRLTRFFTTAELDDGSVGACMSYYRQPDNVLGKVEERLQAYCADPFRVKNMEMLQQIVAEHVAHTQQRDWLVASVMATIASALSAPYIRNGGDEWFEVSKRRPGN